MCGGRQRSDPLQQLECAEEFDMSVKLAQALLRNSSAEEDGANLALVPSDHSLTGEDITYSVLCFLLGLLIAVPLFLYKRKLVMKNAINRDARAFGDTRVPTRTRDV